MRRTQFGSSPKPCSFSHDFTQGQSGFIRRLLGQFEFSPALLAAQKKVRDFHWVS